MSRRDEFVTKCMDVIIGLIDPSQIEDVRNALYEIASDYEVEKRNTEIVPADSFVPDYYAVYIAQKRVAGRSIGTLKLYHSYLMDFFLNKPAPIDQMDTALALKYLYDFKKRRNVSNRTLDSVRIVLYSFFQWALNEGYVQRNFFANVDPIKYTARPREPLTEEECEVLRDACETFRERAILDTFLSTGIRVSELVAITWADIDMQHKRINIIGKGGKYRTVLFDSKTKVSILRYKLVRPGKDPHVFVQDKYPYEGLQKPGVELLIGKLAKRSGLSARITPHILRHTFATLALAKGMSLERLQKLLGHNQISTTLIYAEIKMEDVEAEYRRVFGA